VVPSFFAQKLVNSAEPAKNSSWNRKLGAVKITCSSELGVELGTLLRKRLWRKLGALIKIVQGQQTAAIVVHALFDPINLALLHDET
jgi:hypothetical protein